MLQNLAVQYQPLEGQGSHLRLSGDLDMFTCAQLKETLSPHIAGEGFFLLMDLDRVRYIDSMGLGTLLAAVNGATHRHGHIAFVCSQPHLLKLFRVTGVDRVLEIYPTEEEARLKLGLQPIPA